MIRRDFLKTLALSPTGILLLQSQRPLKADDVPASGLTPNAAFSCLRGMFVEFFHDMQVVRYVIRKITPTIPSLAIVHDLIWSLNQRPIASPYVTGNDIKPATMMFDKYNAFQILNFPRPGNLQNGRVIPSYIIDFEFLESEKGWDPCGRPWPKLEAKDWHGVLPIG